MGEPARVETVALEGRDGGPLYERWRDGGEVDWGRCWPGSHRRRAADADDEDRQIVTDDLATGPWFGLGAG